MEQNYQISQIASVLLEIINHWQN